MTDQGVTAAEQPPASSPAGEGRTDPAVHYSYLGLAALLYGAIAGGSLYHVNALAARLEISSRPMPAISAPLFYLVGKLGSLILLPLGAIVLLEVVAPRKLTRLYLATTLFLLAVGVYVAIALWLPTRGSSQQ